MAISAEHAQAFSGTLSRLTGSDNYKIGLAVSGGGDSLALLLLAATAIPDRIAVATVDHKLRPEAADEADYVARMCAQLGIAHSILTPDRPIAGNVQSQARKLRYDLLHLWAQEQGCDWIATAHHADDQMETFLMRLARGSGVSGLASIRERNGQIIRPLLNWRRDILRDICLANGVVPVDDPSNMDLRFDRIKMRIWLSQHDLPIGHDAILRSSAALQDAAEALDWSARQLFANRVDMCEGKAQINVVDVPMEYQYRLVVMTLALLAPDFTPRSEAIIRAIAALGDGHKAMVGDWLLCPGQTWTITPAPPRARAVSVQIEPEPR